MLDVEAPIPDRLLEWDEIAARIDALASRAPGSHRVLGRSRAGRPLHGFEVGEGALTVSLISGSHADEPVGTVTLLALLDHLLGDSSGAAELRGRFRFRIAPHVNPDGHVANHRWIAAWPDPRAYLEHRLREPPGDDVEFGYPSLRPENRALADWWRIATPFRLHVSLHGMGLAEGGLLLIERAWGGRCEPIREAFRTAVASIGLGLHDHDRGGEKGFEYLGPGFATTPRGAAMRAHFRAAGDHAMAARFQDSSMEYLRGFGGDSLSLVTEIPLYVLTRFPHPRIAGDPVNYRACRTAAQEVLFGERDWRSLVAEYGLRHVPVGDQVACQLAAIRAGLTVTERLKGASGNPAAQGNRL